MRTRVGIVGAGPAGLTLAHLLHREGIDCVVLEARSREYIEARVRAGLLEQNTTDLLREIGAGDRMDREGLPHDGIHLRFEGRTLDIPITELTGRRITIYGQQEIVKDLVASWLDKGAPLHFEVSGVALHDLESERPRITYVHEDAEHELECDVVAGCDGFHGASRPSIPGGVLTEHEHTYPFAWLGILAEAEPTTRELIYAWHERGFGLYSMRSPTISRLYLQVPAGEELGAWPDERIWEELQARFATGDDWRVGEGPIVEKGITPMRSFVCEPMQHGRLFLAGDAAHIVPPTGAKGLNLAVNDVRLLARGIAELVASGSTDGLDRYSERALRRVWRAQDFSNRMTQLLHRLDGGAFEQRLQLSRLDELSRSEVARRSLAENYAGLPATDEF
jgi:p-hydroxybenzoate 3-monooxygenase